MTTKFGQETCPKMTPPHVLLHFYSEIFFRFSFLVQNIFEKKYLSEIFRSIFWRSCPMFQVLYLVINCTAVWPISHTFFQNFFCDTEKNFHIHYHSARKLTNSDNFLVVIFSLKKIWQWTVKNWPILPNFGCHFFFKKIMTMVFKNWPIWGSCQKKWQPGHPASTGNSKFIYSKSKRQIWVMSPSIKW